MVFGLCCQRERLYKPLYVVQVFNFAGVVYCYFQGSVGKTAPENEIAGESSQRLRVKSGSKQTSEGMTPKATRGPNATAPKEEIGILSQDEGEENKKIPKKKPVYPSVLHCPPTSEGTPALRKGPPSRGPTGMPVCAS
ncbi:uncharacterized protein [Manis javanica]|uniref:uncharacterized protein isoform X2 n=1 Tax=Manis javanica TaxID=9974 RepID=UPI003C6D7AFF